MSDSGIRTLVVLLHYPERLSYFSDWMDALEHEARLDVVPANLATPRGKARARRHARDAELIVVLHSAIGDSLREIERVEDALTRRTGPMVAFIGNEVSLPNQPLRAKVELLQRLQPEFIGTQLLLDSARQLYADVGAKVLPLPHALNPVAFRAETPNATRPVDVGFRGARYLPSLGDDDRNRIVDYFASTTFDPPLRTDIRTDVSYGRRGWAEFLNRCKATVGSESGAQHVELESGSVAGDAGVMWRAKLRPVHRYLPRPAKNFLRRAAGRVARGPRPVDAPARPAAAVGVSGKCVSSRHFDAIGTETCQILFPGRYNDLLVADRHYLCLKRDLSNLDDVLARFRDDTQRTELVRTTREWAVDGQTYAHRVRDMLDAVGA